MKRRQDRPDETLRKRAEEALVEERQPAAMVNADIERTLHELQVHQIELEMQNGELRRSREHLEQSRSEYADLYDFAPVGYLTLDKMGLITRANLTATSLLGIERSLLVKTPFALFVHPESQDLFYFHTQKVGETPS
jgi:PAS domain-containing protein